MRRFSIACACVAGLLTGQTGLAAAMQWEFCMAKANISDEAFDKDSFYCGRKASTPVWKSCHGSAKTDYMVGPTGTPLVGPPQVHTMSCSGVVDARPRPDDYIQCMTARGYQYIPEGCHAANSGH